MSKARTLGQLLDSDGDVKSTHLDNVPASDDANALTSGTLPAGRISSLASSKLTGTIADARFPATLPAISAENLTSIPAGELTGTISDSRLSTATTQSASDNSTKISTTAYTDTAISNLVDSSPTTLNTLNELAAALGDDANYATTTATSLGEKLPKAGGTMTGDLNLGNDVDINFGDSADLKIYHDGSNSIIKDAGDGELQLITNGTKISLKTAEGDTLAAFNRDGDCSLRYDGSKKLATVTGGVYVTGNVYTGDNGKFVSGGGDDLQIYHDGLNSYVSDQGTGQLILLTNSFRLNNVGNAKNIITAEDGGAVTLFHNDGAKIATTSTGIDVTGTVTADGGLIQTGSSGGTAHSTADDFVVEGSGHTGITIFGGNSHSSRLHFGDSGSNEAGLVIYNHSTDLLELGTAGTPRVQLDSSGNLKVTAGNLVIGTNGKGIDFSANTDDYSPDAGGEVLDDYEEGDFTPAYILQTPGDSSWTIDRNYGRYTKIGRQVFFQFFIRSDAYSNSTGAGRLQVSGLPFTSSSESYTYRPVSIYAAAFAANNNPRIGHINAGASVVELNMRSDANNDDQSLDSNSCTNGTNKNGIYASGSYYV